MNYDEPIQMNVRIPAELHQRCLEDARDKGQSLAEWIRRAMQDKIDASNNSTMGDKTSDKQYAELVEKINELQRAISELNEWRNEQENK